MGSQPMPKRSIRETMLDRRKHCSAATCLALSLKIQDKFLASAMFRNASSLAVYSPISNEVMTEEIAQRSLKSGKRLVYPRIQDESLEFVEVTCLESLRPGAYGILEPDGNVVLQTAEIDLLLIPGVAFDRLGHRLGYGKGFYDRVLERCHSRVLRVGLAYDFQVLDKLPVQEHDRPVSVLVTESRTLTFTAAER